MPRPIPYRPAADRAHLSLARWITIASALACVVADAAAADERPSAPSPSLPSLVPSLLPGWSGLYLGVVGGYGWSQAMLDSAQLPGGISATVPRGVLGAVEPKGYSLGVEGGLNWQINSFVIGVEADVSRSALRTTTATPIGTLTFGIDWLATLRGRAGYVIGNVMVYGTAGFVAAGATGEANLAAFGFSFQRSSSAYLAGLAIGAGAEMMVLPSWTVKAEVLHFDIGTAALVRTGAFPLGADLTFTTIRAGINHKF